MSEKARGEALLAELRRSRVLAILRGLPPVVVIPAVRALARGGIQLFEVTTDSPGWEDSIKRLVGAEASDGGRAQVGTGTVLTIEQAERAHQAGATFLVSPVLVAEISEYARRADLGYIPGALTPAEIYAADAGGATCVKVFPADAFGPTYLQRLLQPMPRLKLLPTGGVTVESAAAYLKAGALGVGLGGGLVDRATSLQATEERARRLMAAVLSP